MEVVKKEILKLLDAGIIYPISDSRWVSPVYVVPKKTGITVIENDNGELVPTRIQNGWRMCVDYRKLNASTRKDHFPLPSIHQMVDETAGAELMSFMDAFKGYHQIMMHHEDESKTAFVTPDGLYCYRVMPFGLRNAGATYQRMVNMLFADLLGRTMEAYI
ncbi:PREDICTED: uncharacterized protein LOC109146926, partial [Ipomoea nil]|uniref:uncharacterized protein LOC109146926 n=1 Tax=Ipomoea nil TaxID=35883 RepID=UPI0009011459